jgi:hypothetical protein
MSHFWVPAEPFNELVGALESTGLYQFWMRNRQQMQINTGQVNAKRWMKENPVFAAYHRLHFPDGDGSEPASGEEVRGSGELKFVLFLCKILVSGYILAGVSMVTENFLRRILPGLKLKLGLKLNRRMRIFCPREIEETPVFLW